MDNPNFRIKKLKIHNFKSFQDLEIELSKFNVVVGPNASGKSNFKQIFSFFNDIITRGLENAISNQGGSNYIRRLSSSDKTLKMEFHFESDVPNEIYQLHPRRDYGNVVTTNNIIYRFSLQFNNNSNYKITDDVLEIVSTYSLESEKNKTGYQGKVIISKRGTEIKRKYDFPPSAGSILQKHYELFEFSPLTNKQLLIESKVFGFLVLRWNEFLSRIGIYDFEPRLLKSASTLKSESKLNSDGSNFSYILDNIVKNAKYKKKLENLTNDLLPFFKAFKIERTSDGSLRFKLKENYDSKNIPAPFVSDGTVNIMALITCLFLQENQLTVIEEPERNIHPGLLSGITKLMQDVSEENQIIVTTHNLTILDLIDMENILLVGRTKNGSSTIIKPMNHKMIQKFKGIMSMKDLMNQNLLG